MMKGFTQFFIGCTVVCALSVVDPGSARWFALAGLGVLYLISAMPRRKSFGSATRSGTASPLRRARR